MSEILRVGGTDRRLRRRELEDLLLQVLGSILNVERVRGGVI